MQAIKLLYVMQENRIIENCSQLHTVILVICRPANIVWSTDQNYSIVTDNVSICVDLFYCSYTVQTPE